MGSRIILCLYAIGLCSCAFASEKTNTVQDISNEKKYAVAYCLSKSYPDSEFSSDSKHVAGAYIQKGSLGIDVYESIRNHVDLYIERPYVSKHEVNLNIMQCIDLYGSESLDLVIK